MRDAVDFEKINNEASVLRTWIDEVNRQLYGCERGVFL